MIVETNTRLIFISKIEKECTITVKSTEHSIYRIKEIIDFPFSEGEQSAFEEESLLKVPQNPEQLLKSPSKDSLKALKSAEALAARASRVSREKKIQDESILIDQTLNF